MFRGKIMVSDFGTTRYCKDCGEEIVRDGDVITMYFGKKICKRTKEKPYCTNKEKQGVKNG